MVSFHAAAPLAFLSSLLSSSPRTLRHLPPTTLQPIQPITPILLHQVPPTSASVSSSSSSSIHQDEEGNCIFGKKDYWDEMYQGEGDRPSEAYSWYCGWSELAPFWIDLVGGKKAHVLIAGVGNDPTPMDMYDDGWTNMTAFDYSQPGVDRARELFSERQQQQVAASNATNNNALPPIHFLTADARNLPLADASVDATLDKGTLDAIYITGEELFQESIQELGRVTAPGGAVLCISRVVYPDDFFRAFDKELWEIVWDGSLAFASGGEATIDLGADLFAWRRTVVPWSNSTNNLASVPSC